MAKLIHVHRPKPLGPGMREGQNFHPQIYVLGVRVRLEFKLADFWIGGYYDKGEQDWLSGSQEHNLWICILPTLPLHLSWWRTLPSLAAASAVHTASGQVSPPGL